MRKLRHDPTLPTPIAPDTGNIEPPVVPYTRYVQNHMLGRAVGLETACTALLDAAGKQFLLGKDDTAQELRRMARAFEEEANLLRKQGPLAPAQAVAAGTPPEDLEIPTILRNEPPPARGAEAAKDGAKKPLGVVVQKKFIVHPDLAYEENELDTPPFLRKAD